MKAETDGIGKGQETAVCPPIADARFGGRKIDDIEWSEMILVLFVAESKSQT